MRADGLTYHASKEEQLERLGRAAELIRRATHYLALAKEQPEKRDWREFAVEAIYALNSALANEDAENVPGVEDMQCPSCGRVSGRHRNGCPQVKRRK